MKIIFVCGVIKSGKDYYFEEYKRQHPDEEVIEIKLSNPIREMIEIVDGIDLSDKAVYEQWKSIPENRQKMVDLGAYLKTVKDKLIFAEIALYNILHCENGENKTFIISDFRFPFELDPFAHYAYHVDEGDIYVHFCNYKSEGYNSSIDQHTEYMAQWLCRQGYEHNTHWNLDDFLTLIQKYDDKKRIN